MESANIYAYFIIYSFLGWVCEDVYCGIGKRKFINRGFFYGPYCPIYGFGALLVLYPLLILGKHPVFVFLAGMVLTSILEYFTSYVMEKLFATRWWDYSSRPFNIHGRVCLQNSLIFGVLSLVVVYGIHPVIRAVVEQVNVNTLLVYEIIFSFCFFIDVFMTIITLIKRKNILKSLKIDMDELIFQFEKDRNEFNEHLEKWIEIKRSTLELKGIQDRIASMEKFKEKHVLRAFPDREISKKLKSIEELSDKIKNIK